MGPLVEAPDSQTTFWATCRRVLHDWYGLNAREDDDLSAQWSDELADLALNLDRLCPLINFATMLVRSDPQHVIGLVPELRVLEPFDAVVLFRNSDAMEVAFGVLLDESDAPLEVYGFDFDRPRHYEELSAKPELFRVSSTIEAFVLGMLIQGFAPHNALMAMGEHGDLDLIVERLTEAFGPPNEFDEFWLFGGDEILLGVQWFPALGSYKIDLVALSEAACRPLSPELLGTLGFPSATVSAHEWRGGV